MKKVVASEPSAFIPENPIAKAILSKFMDEESADVSFEVTVADAPRVRSYGQQSKMAKASTIFHAHSLILEDSAPVLAQLAASAGDSTPIPITDVKPNIFRHLLFYVYGGKLSGGDLEDNAKEIIDAADRFEVVNLKLEAEASLVWSISIENVTELLLYAHDKNCAFLKEKALDFLMEHSAEASNMMRNESIPGALFADLLTAVNRGKKKTSTGGNGDDLSTMSVTDLRRKLHAKGLHVDGSREAMIAALEQKAEVGRESPLL